MKLKKIAVRGLIALAFTVALCMFFANTIVTMTTPKVRIIKGDRGRLEQKITLDAVVYFPETTDYTPDRRDGEQHCRGQGLCARGTNRHSGRNPVYPP